MWNMIWPIIIVVASNTVYNITTKSTPSDVNGFASLSLSYVVATVFSIAMFFITGEQKNLIVELSKTNWSAWVLGIVLVGLEFGYICIYRAGWKIGVVSLVANICLACVLLLIGFLVYKEVLSVWQIAGVCLCGVGLFLITK